MRRSGFTLLEILLVLAILVVVAAMTMPALNRIAESQRLTQGAELIRSEWMSAHVRAMRTGQMQMFRYEQGGTLFRVETWQADEDATDAATATGDPNNPQRMTVDSLDPIQKEKVLPDGLIFFGGDAKFENRSQDVEQEAMGSGAWSRPIIFYPDGSTSTAYIIVANERKQSIRVELRGLTGSVTVRERELIQ